MSARFAGQAAEMLETLRKTESSLRRLRESRTGDAPGDGAGALSNTDKVHVQLFLDAQVRGRCLFWRDMHELYDVCRKATSGLLSPRAVCGQLSLREPHCQALLVSLWSFERRVESAYIPS